MGPSALSDVGVPGLGFYCGFGLGKLKRLFRQEFSRHGSNCDGFLISGTAGTRCGTSPPLSRSIRRSSRPCLAVPGEGGAGVPPVLLTGLFANVRRRKNA